MILLILQPPGGRGEALSLVLFLLWMIDDLNTIEQLKHGPTAPHADVILPWLAQAVDPRRLQDLFPGVPEQYGGCAVGPRTSIETTQALGSEMPHSVQCRRL